MKAFRDVEQFCSHVKLGKQALKGEHRSLLVEVPAVRVDASLDFEAAIAPLRLQQKRWDYFIATSTKPDRLHAIEVHRYDPSVLAEKKSGTLEVLNEICPEAGPTIDSWSVVVRGNLPRSDLTARFRADTKIRVERVIDVGRL